MSTKKSPKRERVTLASIDRKIDLLESRIATLKAYETMMAEMEEAETDKLRAGDLAVIKDNSILGAGVLCDDPLKLGWRIDFPNGEYRLIGRGCAARPTQAEIAAHKKAKEEAEELAKPIGFGTRVKLVSDGIEWRVATEIPDASGSYRLVEYTPDNGPIWRKRHEFTVITE